MSLEIYHLRFAQSDRIVWLCEELSLLIPTFTYKLHTFPRGLETSVGKQALLKLSPTGTAPTMVDNSVSPSVTISESQAILMYILAVHGQGHLHPAHPPQTSPHDYAQYLFWLSFANGSAQAFLNVDIYFNAVLQHGIVDPDEFKKGILAQSFAARTPTHLKMYDERLANNKYLAGEDFSAADIMNIYALTTFRLIFPIDLTPYPNVVRWLRDITVRREGYRRAMDKCEDGLPALYAPQVPQVGFEVLLSAAPWESVEALKLLKEEQVREVAELGKA